MRYVSENDNQNNRENKHRSEAQQRLPSYTKPLRDRHNSRSLCGTTELRN